MVKCGWVKNGGTCILEQENQELKNSLERYQKELNEENLQCSKYAIEINDLKEQIEESYPMHMDKGYKLAERKYEDKQKEFIEWLEDSINILETEQARRFNHTYQYKIDVFKQCLSKYKEIVGDDNVKDIA